MTCQDLQSMIDDSQVLWNGIDFCSQYSSNTVLMRLMPDLGKVKNNGMVYFTENEVPQPHDE